jgi:D-sedoheptulose 7-phosphate isomerase
MQNMDLTVRIHQHFEDSAQVKLQSKSVLTQPIAATAQAMVSCLQQDGKILCCGNGGSAADAQHFAAELINRFEIERPGLAAIALTTDSSVLTSITTRFSPNRCARSGAAVMCCSPFQPVAILST